MVLCTEAMGCGRGWVKWILLGTGTASVSVSFSVKHPEIYYMILGRMRRVSQPKVLLVVLIWVSALPCAGGMSKKWTKLGIPKDQGGS